VVEGVLGITISNQSNIYGELEITISNQLPVYGELEITISNQSNIYGELEITISNQLQVPDTFDFCLSQVCAVVIPTVDTLVNCFIDAIDSFFDPIYKGYKDRLSNFRNYNNRYSDWFLPSKDELDKMYINLHKGTDENAVIYAPVGGFSNSDYQSSSEDGVFLFYQQLFTNGIQSSIGKGSLLHLRACRSFTSVIPSYNLRDIGPAGGLVFYKNGNNYMECPLTDQSASKLWSNIAGQLIGTTGTAIGTGQANTTAIIGQAGHTDSAAKLCDDLLI